MWCKKRPAGGEERCDEPGSVLCVEHRSVLHLLLWAPWLNVGCGALGWGSFSNQLTRLLFSTAN